MLSHVIVDFIGTHDPFFDKLSRAWADHSSSPRLLLCQDRFKS